MRVRILAAAGTAALALAGSVLAASPALAACGASGDVCTGSTVATFTLTGGSLQISVPAGDATTPDTLGGATAVAGSALTVSGALGDVTVDDQRAAFAAVWAVTVDSTNFVTGGSSTQETVSNAVIGYTNAGATNDTSGYTGAFTASSPVSLAAPATAGAWAGVGVNSATWNPTISFGLLPDQVAGTYTGTITHSLL